MKLTVISTLLALCSFNICSAVKDALKNEVGKEDIDSVISALLSQDSKLEVGSFNVPGYTFSLNEQFNIGNIEKLPKNAEAMKNALLKGMDEDINEKEKFNIGGDDGIDFYQRVFRLYKISNMISVYEFIVKTKMQDNIKLLDEYKKVSRNFSKKLLDESFLKDPAAGKDLLDTSKEDFISYIVSNDKYYELKLEALNRQDLIEMINALRERITDDAEFRAQITKLLNENYFDLNIHSKTDYAPSDEFSRISPDEYERFFDKFFWIFRSNFSALKESFDHVSELGEIPEILREFSKWHGPLNIKEFTELRTYSFVKSVFLREVGVNDQQDKVLISNLDDKIAKEMIDFKMKTIDFLAATPKLSEEYLRSFEFLTASARSDFLKVKIVNYDMKVKEFRIILLNNQILNESEILFYDPNFDRNRGAPPSTPQSASPLRATPLRATPQRATPPRVTPHSAASSRNVSRAPPNNDLTRSRNNSFIGGLLAILVTISIGGFIFYKRNSKKTIQGLV